MEAQPNSIMEKDTSCTESEIVVEENKEFGGSGESEALSEELEEDAELEGGFSVSLVKTLLEKAMETRPQNQGEKIGMQGNFIV